MLTPHKLPLCIWSHLPFGELCWLDSWHTNIVFHSYFFSTLSFQGCQIWSPRPAFTWLLFVGQQACWLPWCLSLVSRLAFWIQVSGSLDVRSRTGTPLLGEEEQEVLNRSLWWTWNDKELLTWNHLFRMRATSSCKVQHRFSKIWMILEIVSYERLWVVAASIHRGRARSLCSVLLPLRLVFALCFLKTSLYNKASAHVTMSLKTYRARRGNCRGRSKTSLAI